MEKSLGSFAFCAALRFSLFADSLAGWFCNLERLGLLLLGRKGRIVHAEQVANCECVDGVDSSGGGETIHCTNI